MTSEQPPIVYQYKVSLETNQKYVQPQITVYGDNKNLVRQEAIQQLMLTMEDLKKEGFAVPPIEVTKE